MKNRLIDSKNEKLKSIVLVLTILSCLGFWFLGIYWLVG